MKKLDYDFGTLTLGDRFIIGEINEGAEVTREMVLEVIGIADKHFQGKTWGYISNRVHSFSTDPTIFMQAKQLDEKMVAFAAVIYREISKKVTEYEQGFIGDSFSYAVFDDLDEAISWVQSKLS